MMIALYFLLTFLIVIVEATTIRIPLTLLMLIAFSVFLKKEWVFILAGIAGLLLDSLTFRPLGVTSLFFLCVLGLIFLYQRKFETQHILFIILATVVLAVSYNLLFGTANMIESIVLVALCVGVWAGFILFIQRRHISASN